MSAVYPAPVTRVYGETMALTTSLVLLGLFPDTHQLMLYDPSVDFRLHLNPSLLSVEFYDASGTSGSRFVKNGSTSSLKQDLTDRASGTGTGTVIDSMTTSDYLYVCTYDIIGGFSINVKAVNGTTNTMVWEYYKNDDSWAALSITDNTASGGVSLAQDGTVTWTAPTDAVMVSLGGSNGKLTNTNTAASPPATPPGTDPPTTNGFWWRMSFTTAGLDSDTEIEEIITLNKDSNRGYFRAGKEYSFSLDRRAVGAIEALLAAGTDTLQVTHVRTK